MSVILSAVFIFIFRVVLTVPVNQTSRARWCRNQGHFSNSWILPMHFFTAVCRCQCFIGHDSRTACRCRHCSVQLTSYFDHGLCGSNKLLYKRCAKSMGRPKFRPPHCSHIFQLILMKLQTKKHIRVGSICIQHMFLTGTWTVVGSRCDP